MPPKEVEILVAFHVPEVLPFRRGRPPAAAGSSWSPMATNIFLCLATASFAAGTARELGYGYELSWCSHGRFLVLYIRRFESTTVQKGRQGSSSRKERRRQSKPSGAGATSHGM